MRTGVKEKFRGLKFNINLDGSFRLRKNPTVKNTDSFVARNINWISYIFLFFFFCIAIGLLALAIVYPSSYLEHSYIMASSVKQPPAVNADINKDSDIDGFNDALEVYLGTDPYRACMDGQYSGKPSITWPADISTAGAEASSLNKIDDGDFEEFLTLAGNFGAKDAAEASSFRFDLNGDGRINLSDLEVIQNLKPPMFGGLNAYMGPVCKQKIRDL